MCTHFPFICSAGMPWQQILKLSGYDATPRHTHPSRIGGPINPKGDDIKAARTELEGLLAVAGFKPPRANTAVKSLRVSLLDKWRGQDYSLLGEVDVTISLRMSVFF
jgi:hypothetical protein